MGCSQVILHSQPSPAPSICLRRQPLRPNMGGLGTCIPSWALCSDGVEHGELPVSVPSLPLPPHPAREGVMCVVRCVPRALSQREWWWDCPPILVTPPYHRSLAPTQAAECVYNTHHSVRPLFRLNWTPSTLPTLSINSQPVGQWYRGE